MEEDQLEPSKSALDALTEKYEKQKIEDTKTTLLHLEDEYRSTKNSLYVWRALEYLSNPPGDKLDMPNWVRSYLRETSRGIWWCASRHDYVRIMELASTKNATFDEFSRVMDIRISPSECINQVLIIMGFKRPGWNAFHDFKNLENMLDDYFEYGEMLDEGMTSRDAIHELMDKRGVVDERSMRRRMAQARARYSKGT